TTPTQPLPRSTVYCSLRTLASQPDGHTRISGCHPHYLNRTTPYRTTGRSILKTVPRPNRLFTRILPLWFSIIPFTIHNPRPVPFSPLVDTTGSKTVLMISGVF